jgi:hypothetical protein
LAHRYPKVPDQRLPPILRMPYQAPIPDYSKGSRGLSVLPRVSGIFTTTTISPSPLLRQCSSRYAVHARRNLPDKELRYLRTVIVTAAVYRGFSRKLCFRRSEPTSLTFRHRAGVILYTSTLSVSTELCF